MLTGAESIGYKWFAKIEVDAITFGQCLIIRRSEIVNRRYSFHSRSQQILAVSIITHEYG
jgi:hypothetical protein